VTSCGMSFHPKNKFMQALSHSLLGSGSSTILPSSTLSRII
jgi:hypothetical protein